VEEDIQAEIQAAEISENDQEEEKEDKPKPKAQRGIKKPKDEFFDASESDDDGVTSSAYAKPSRGGAQQARGGRRGRGGKLNLEDDFPSL